MCVYICVCVMCVCDVCVWDVCVCDVCVCPTSSHHTITHCYTCPHVLHLVFCYYG